MNIVSNSVTPNDVVEETRDGDRYLVVKDVPFVKPMDLAGGYVPEEEIKQSVDDWTVELTANHPRNKPGKPWYREGLEDNQPISVNTSQSVQREYVVGQAEDPYHDGTWVNADMAINADVAEAMGGVAADIVEKVENGEAFDVSSQYIPKPLPAGEYDGKHRANVEGIDEPDSIALLPHKPGQCSMDEGCGINPEVAANSADVRVPVADDPYSGEDAGEDAIMTDDLDLENPDDETKRTVGERVMSVFGWGTDGEQTANEGAESSADPTSDMKERTAELVANHDFDADNLPSEETQCFDRIYEAVTSNDEDEPAESEAETEETDDESEMTEDGITLTEEELDARIEEKAQELVANQKEESEKESLAAEIVANSAEYDDTEAVTEDFPTVAALETKKEQVTDSGALPGTGATANAQGDELDDISSGVFD